jgi:hypothetical protein
MSVTTDPAAALLPQLKEQQQCWFCVLLHCGAVNDGVSALGDLLCYFHSGIEECSIAAASGNASCPSNEFQLQSPECYFIAHGLSTGSVLPVHGLTS